MRTGPAAWLIFRGKALLAELDGLGYTPGTSITIEMHSTCLGNRPPSAASLLPATSSQTEWRSFRTPIICRIARDTAGWLGAGRR